MSREDKDLVHKRAEIKTSPGARYVSENISGNLKRLRGVGGGATDSTAARVDSRCDFDSSAMINYVLLVSRQGTDDSDLL